MPQHDTDRQAHPGMTGRRPSRRLPAALSVIGLGLAAVVAVVLMGGGSPVSASVSPYRQEWLAPAPVHEAPVHHSERIRLQPGQTAIGALASLGLSAPETYRAVAAARGAYALNRVHAGHMLTRVDDAAGLHVYYDIDAGRRLRLDRIPGGPPGGRWQAALEQRRLQGRVVMAEGVIGDSFFVAAEKAGLDETTAMNLVDIFAWDIDFARDIRPGDSFRVLYEEHYDEDGRMLGTTILAAGFRNQGEDHEAVRYRIASGRYDYFSPEGKSLRKSFLKAPLKYTRISSRFSLHRLHPILGYTRAHKGVDYAAPIGTPVHAVGDGVVTYCGWRGGYGRFILIRHTDGVHGTAYGHLSRYARGIHCGTHVRQGQVIAYVGMSGLATGPHLHFEFRIHGVQVNPLTVKRTPADPVPYAQMAAFRQAAAPLLTRIDAPGSMLAWN